MLFLPKTEGEFHRLKIVMRPVLDENPRSESFQIWCVDEKIGKLF